MRTDERRSAREARIESREGSTERDSGRMISRALALKSLAIPALALLLAPAAGVVVFPFENLSDDRSLYWVSEALADGLDREIKGSGVPTFGRPERLSVIEEMGVPTNSTLTLASQIKAAEELGAAALLCGTFRAGDDAVRARARIVDVPAGRTGPWVEVHGSIKDIYALQRALHAAVRAALPRGSGPQTSPAGGSPAPEDGAPQTAYEFLLKSYFEDVPQRREVLLRRALDIAPDYLRAQVELAQVYADSGQSEKAAGVLSRISTRDRGLAAQAENLLAEIEIARARTSSAESALRRSLASKETARAHLLLAKIALARADRAAARSELERSRALDPDDPDLGELEGALSSAGPPQTSP